MSIAMPETERKISLHALKRYDSRRWGKGVVMNMPLLWMLWIARGTSRGLGYEQDGLNDDRRASYALVRKSGTGFT